MRTSATVRPNAPTSAPRIIPSRLVRWLPLAGVLLVVAMVYAPTLNDYFGGDDFLVIGPVKNIGPWESIWKAFVMQDDIVYWRPLVSPIYALYVHVFWLRPWAYHLVVLALHLANVTLLVAVATALTRRRGVGLTAGLIFGIHAAHTTTVAQISSTVELFSVVWYLSAVLCAVLYVRTPPPSPLPTRCAGREGRQALGTLAEEALPLSAPKARGGGWGEGWYWLSLGAFVLALLSKESTASAAGVITVLFFLNAGPPERRLARFFADSAPYWALVIPYIAFTYVTDTDDPTGITRQMYHPGPSVGQNMWWFLSRLAAPLEAGHGPHVSAVGHAGAALLLTAAVLSLAFGNRQVRFLVLWTGIALTPLALWRPDLLLGRFTYQASAPFAVLLALAGAWLADHLRSRVPARPPSWAVGAALALLAVAAYAPLTLGQNRERTREGEDYRLLVGTLRRELPAVPANTDVELLDGIWSGPFHALYLDAVADTLYGAGTVHIVNVDSGEAVPDVQGHRSVWLRYAGGALTVRDGP